MFGLLFTQKKCAASFSEAAASKPEIARPQTASEDIRLVLAGVTLREAEVWLWVMRGKTSSEIAVILGSKTVTVSKHLEHVYQKLGVENRTAAASVASELIA